MHHSVVLVSRRRSLVRPRTCHDTCRPLSAEQSVRSSSQIIPIVKLSGLIPRLRICNIPIEQRRLVPHHVHVLDEAIVENLNRNVASSASLAIFLQTDGRRSACSTYCKNLAVLRTGHARF